MAAKTANAAGSRGRLTIVEDEAAMGRILMKSLGMEGYEATHYQNPTEALEAIERDQPDAVLTDVRMPGMTGIELLERLREKYPEIPVLIMTAFGTIEDAVAALKAGAFNYITKPFQQEYLLHQLELAMRQRRLEQEVSRLSEPGAGEIAQRPVIGGSAPMQRVREMIDRAAKAGSPVLITGESGVGKELVAREIHRQSPRRRERFVALNCPAIPAQLIESELFGYERGAFTGADQPKMGLIELSAGGTIFLDEIAELPNEIQAKLLRVLQEREIQRLGGLRTIAVDLRIIAATNRDLAVEIKAGRFREDLYYRLNVVNIDVPPLRERRDDIGELAEYFVERIGRRTNRPGLKIAPETRRRLIDYNWPGNIRELENVVERMVIFARGEELDESLLPAEMTAKGKVAAADETSPDLREALGGGADEGAFVEKYREARERFERAYLEELLRRHEGNVSEAARSSGISRRSLYEKLEKYDVKKD